MESLLYNVFFLTFPIFTALVDITALGVRNWPPAAVPFVRDALQWWVREYDPLLKAAPLWFQTMTTVEAVVCPLYCVLALRALWSGVYRRCFVVPTVVFTTVCVYSVVVIAAENVLGYGRGLDDDTLVPWALAYLPYVVVPLLWTRRVLARTKTATAAAAAGEKTTTKERTKTAGAGGKGSAKTSRDAAAKSGESKKARKEGGKSREKNDGGGNKGTGGKGAERKHKSASGGKVVATGEKQQQHAAKAPVSKAEGVLNTADAGATPAPTATSRSRTAHTATSDAPAHHEAERRRAEAEMRTPLTTRSGRTVQGRVIRD